jgi:hypothetical protein
MQRALNSSSAAQVDSFVIPAAWVQIASVSPSGGPLAGGSTITIIGALLRELCLTCVLAS